MPQYGFDEVIKPTGYGPGFGMRIDEGLKNTVVFMGYESPDGPVGAALDCRATGFLVARDGIGYLITARHVANVLGGDPFWVRLNLRKGGIGDRLYADQVAWDYHPDPDVDLACVQFHVPRKDIYHCTYLASEEMIPDNPQHDSALIGIGDNTYTLGLFRLMSGRTRNLPVAHSGNVAMLPSDELIPVRDWDKPPQTNAVRFVEGYLVETHSVPGLSGSPVFVRSAVGMPEERDSPALLVPRAGVSLLGVWQGSWDAPPGEVLTAETREGIRVPLGMGVVVPGSKIREMLDSDPVGLRRREDKSRAQAMMAASTDTAFPNPFHLPPRPVTHNIERISIVC